jgi:hypothetical protein
MKITSRQEGGPPEREFVSAALQNGDTVRFSRSFLQSLAMLSGPAAPTSVGPFARGTVTAIGHLEPRQLPAAGDRELGRWRHQPGERGQPRASAQEPGSLKPDQPADA